MPAHVHIYGFVDNMEQLMAASDVVVTKAGPGT
jgi:UDP-N-acetylglucosamine:LPS N-acetylglucosamine transferase